MQWIENVQASSDRWAPRPPRREVRRYGSCQCPEQWRTHISTPRPGGR